MRYAGEDDTYSRATNLGEAANSIHKETKIVVDVIEGCAPGGTTARRRRGTSETTSRGSGDFGGGGHELIELLGSTEDSTAGRRRYVIAEGVIQDDQATGLLSAGDGDLRHV